MLLTLEITGSVSYTNDFEASQCSYPAFLDKFSFKANPDPERLPHYGSATLSQGGLW